MNVHLEGGHDRIIFVATETLKSGQVVSGSGRDYTSAINDLAHNHAIAQGENINESLRNL